MIEAQLASRWAPISSYQACCRGTIRDIDRPQHVAAFPGVGLTYTHRGIELDTSTGTQQHILDLLQIELPLANTG